MDYNWLTGVGDHDPIMIDANLAEIDFDDFKNEDIQNAYAYSLQSYVSIDVRTYPSHVVPHGQFNTIQRIIVLVGEEVDSYLN